MSNHPPIIVRASTLARLIDFTEHDNNRKFLAGVRIEPHDDGAVAVATNGKSIGACFDKAAIVSTPITMLVEKRPLKGKLRGNVTDKHFAVIQTTGPVTAEVKITWAPDAQAAAEAQAIETLKVDTLEGYVPDWRRAFRAQLASEGHTLDRKLLKTAMSSLARGSEQVTLRDTSNGSVFVRSEADDFAGVIMPKRETNPELRGVPSWLA